MICLPPDNYVIITNIFLPQGQQGFPGKPVRSLIDFWPWRNLIVLLLVFLKHLDRLVKFCCLLQKSLYFTHLLTVVNWQGEDGEPGYPGPQGPPGAKVPMSFTHQLWYLALIILMYLSLHALILNVYCVLKQGESGTGEKGERGMDGLPGLKVRDQSEMAFKQYSHQ